MFSVLVDIGTPTKLPKHRGKSPGWETGKVRTKAEMLDFDTKLYVSRYSKTNQVKFSTKHEFLKPMNKTNFLTHTSLKIANLI